MLGSTPEEKLQMNEVIECVMDTVREMYKGVFEKDEGRKVRVDFVFKLYNTKKQKQQSWYTATIATD